MQSFWACGVYKLGAGASGVFTKGQASTLTEQANPGKSAKNPMAPNFAIHQNPLGVFLKVLVPGSTPDTLI